MTGSVNFSNTEWLIRSFDSNNNKVMDELKIQDPNLKTQIDTDKNGEISSSELVTAMKADAVEVNQGLIRKSQGFDIFVRGLETLKSVNSTAKNGISNIHIFTPTFYSDDLSRDRYYKLLESNQAYDRGIDQLENSLRSIRDMTSNATDSQSRAIHIQAKTTLNSTQWRTWTARLSQNISLTRQYFDDYSPRSRSGGNYQTRDPFANGGNSTSAGKDPFAGGGNSVGKDPFAGGGNSVGTDPFAKDKDPYGKDPFNGGGSNQDPYGKDPFNGGGSNPSQPVIPNDPYDDRLNPHIRELEMINTNLQASYETMNNALKAIKEQTNDLPDLKSSIKATDGAITAAFSNITALENSSLSASDVANNLRSKADAREKEATGRAAPFAGIGAGIGAVAGGLIGYFAGGQTVKSALIGVGVGAGASAGIGALIGNSIDSKIVGEAQTMRTLAGKVESYKIGPDKQKAMDTNQKLYNELFNAREAHDLDRARVVNNTIDGLRGQANDVTHRTSEILGAYRNH